MSIKHISRIIILTLMVMLGVKSPIPIVNASAGVRAESGVSKTNTSSRSIYKQDSITGENNLELIIKCLISKDCIAVMDEDLRKKLKVSYYDITDLVMEAALSIPPIKGGDPIHEYHNKKLKEHYDKMQSYRRSISQQKQELEDYKELLRISNSKSSSSQDCYHDVEVNTMKKYGVSQEEAHKMIESSDPRVDIVWKEMVDAKMQQDLAQLRARLSHIKNNESRKE